MSLHATYVLERFLSMAHRQQRREYEQSLDLAAKARLSDDGGLCFLHRSLLEPYRLWPALRWYVDQIERGQL